MTDAPLYALTATVQHNCNISDARHGADYSLCVYLMKMREYYRWEKRLPYGAALERDQVGNWLQARERLWEDLEQAALEPIVIDGERFDPFDADAINQRLGAHGLVYSGGLGDKAKPHFFLGALERHQRNGDCSIFVVANEYARDLTAPPAMNLGQTIFLRRESLRRLLWEKLESWRWNRPDNALGRAFACYDFETDLDVALDAMTDREVGIVLLHEQGEYAAGVRLGEDWGRMLIDLVGTPAEIMARAVRDHLADCLSTLPALAQSTDPASLHFFFGNLTNMRKDLYPALLKGYEDWHGGRDASLFAAIAEHGRGHWESIAQAMLELHGRHGGDAAAPIRELVEAGRV